MSQPYVSTLCLIGGERPPSPTYPNRLLIKLLQLVIPRRKRKSSLIGFFLIGLFLESKKRSNYFGYWQPFLLPEEKLNPQEMFVIFFISEEAEVSEWIKFNCWSKLMSPFFGFIQLLFYYPFSLLFIYFYLVFIIPMENTVNITNIYSLFSNLTRNASNPNK